MTITVNNNVIALLGDCGSDDVEPLLGLLQGQPARMVDLTNTTHLHGAVLQVLLAFRPPLSGEAGDAFTQTWLLPLLHAK